MRRIVIAALTVAVLGTLGTGCQSIRPPLRPGAGETGYSNIGIYSVQRFLYPLPIVERATIEALSDMKVHSVRKRVKDDGVSLCGLMFDGRYVYATIESKGQESIVTVNIDLYGDEPLAKILLERVSIRIATLPQGIAPPFDPRALTDSAMHRGAYIEGYRGALLR